MVNVEALAGYANRQVQLEFVDGHIVRARLISVDLEEPREMMYDILEVVAQGPDNLAAVKAGTVAAADPSLLRSFQIL